MPAYLVDSAEHVDPAWLEGARRVGITAGASAPEELVRDLVEKLRHRYGAALSELEATEENTTFPVPARLQG